MSVKQGFWGELLGTYLLVFFGCTSVATAVLFGAQVGILQVALVWGIGLTIAITLTGNLSGAHLNPAMTIAFAAFNGFPWRRIWMYFLAQFLGAFLAAATIFALFYPYFEIYEQRIGVVRGEAGSEASAMIFGEYFPNPGGKPLAPELKTPATFLSAILAELLGTALLSFGIFGFIDPIRKQAMGRAIPLAIGGLLTVLISLFAPLSQAGFNPARDFAPRLFSALAGWGHVPFSANGQGWWIVFIIAPVAGALLGGFLYKKIMSLTGK